MTEQNDALAERLLNIIDADILPLTTKAVAAGNKVFGAAVLRKSDLSLVLAETNNEMENPLWHGEMHTLKRYYERSVDDRPDPKDCIFLSTHEPCSLCLSAITWAGFDNFYYYFSYEDTRDAFSIPHDLKILSEVFKIKDGEYARSNAFWAATHIADLISEQNRRNFEQERDRLNQKYAALSAQYQAGKSDAIPLS